LSPADGWGPLPPHSTPRRRERRVLRWLERLLLVVGIACLGYVGYVSAESALYQAYETRELEAILTSVAERAPAPAETAPAAAASTDASPSAPAPGPPATADTTGTAKTSGTADVPASGHEPPRRGAAIGRIEIPRLGVNAIVRAGSDARTLRLAVGHIPGTSMPGQGNTGLAAHRDTFFRRLGSIEMGDEIRVVTPDGTFQYVVEETMVVNPTDVWVLDPTDEPALTLVTCYPFRFIGSAPQRFIVRAALIPS
jgi:LPXTG-site transpeptidase (sortase) family protein